MHTLTSISSITCNDKKHSCPQITDSQLLSKDKTISFLQKEKVKEKCNPGCRFRWILSYTWSFPELLLRPSTVNESHGCYNLTTKCFLSKKEILNVFPQLSSSSQVTSSWDLPSSPVRSHFQVCASVLCCLYFSYSLAPHKGLQTYLFPPLDWKQLEEEDWLLFTFSPQGYLAYKCSTLFNGISVLPWGGYLQCVT